MFKPLRDHILVRPVKRLQSRILDVVSNEKYSRGLVVAVGPGERVKKFYKEPNNRVRIEETYRIRPMTVKPGDWITHESQGRYGKYAENGVDYWVMQDKDVCFISDRDQIDQHNILSDAEIEALIAAHNEQMRKAA